MPTAERAMACSDDPYVLLGVAPRAPRAEVQKAFRRLVLQWHPDRHRHREDAAGRFQQIVQAYRAISAARRFADTASPNEVAGDWPVWAMTHVCIRVPAQRPLADRLRQRVAGFVLQHLVAVSLSFSAGSASGLTAYGLSEPAHGPTSGPGELTQVYVQKAYSARAEASSASPSAKTAQPAAHE